MAPSVPHTSDREKSTRRFGALARPTAWISIVWERVWPELVPPVAIALVFATVSWIGVWPALPQPVHWVLLAAFALAFLAGFAGLRGVKLPDEAQITRRIEARSRLKDRPLTAQSDPLALGAGDEFADALWREHQARMRTRLKHLTAGTPAANGDKRDRLGLRLFVPILAVAAYLFSYSPQGGRIADAWSPARDGTPVLARTDVWINPPTYTRKPPIYLSRRADSMPGQAAPINAPQGSELFFRYVGDGQISIVYRTAAGETELKPIEPDQIASSSADPSTQPGGELRFSHDLQASGTAVLLERDDEISTWRLEIIPDDPPSIAFTEPPSAALSGSLELSYEVEDDYGVTQAHANIESLESTEQGARPLVEAPRVKLSLPRARAKSGSSRVNRDLSEHPWAGSRVSITLEAEDDAGQTGRSRSHELVLPGRRFSNPVSRALVEQRRKLALDARTRPAVAQMLDAITTRPETYLDDTAAYTGIRMAYRRIVDARNDEQLRSSLDLLWDIALGLEFGDLSDAERALREAQEALSEALENGASDEEIERLMAELRRAMNELMQLLAEQGRQNPLARNPFGNEMAQVLRQRDLERMLDQIENLAKSGSQDAARQLLNELQRLMDNLRAGRHQQQRQAEGNQANEALDKLSELMQRQQELMNETFRMQNENRARGRSQNQQQGERQPGQPSDQQPMTPEEFADALRQLQEQQEALERELGELSRELEELGANPSQEFGEAQSEMGEAGRRLGERQPGEAMENQAQALDALRRGAQSMMQQMAGDRQAGGEEQGQGNVGSSPRRMRDPLGRAQQSRGPDTGDQTRVPGEIDAQRAREILEAIRERLSNPLQPLIERDYLERLLRSR